MLMLGLGVVLEFLVRARVRVKVTAGVRESGEWGYETPRYG